MRSLIFKIAGGLLALTASALSLILVIRASSLSLPIPLLTSLLALFLPFLNYFLLTPSLLPGRSSGKQPAQRTNSTSPLPLTLALLALLDTVLLTLAAADLRPSSLTCSLERRWRMLFHLKDARSIRSIQGTLDCCGFRTTLDNAWPFPGGSGEASRGADACVLAFGRSRACEGVWVGQGRVVLGWGVGLGVVGLVVKLLLLLVLRYRPEWMGEGRVTMGYERVQPQRRIAEEEEGEGETEVGGRYLDEPSREQQEDGVGGGEGRALVHAQASG